MAAIAQRYGMTAARLAEMNGLSANASLRAGRRLQLPEQLPRTLSGAAPAATVAAAESAVAVARKRDGGERAGGRVLRRASWRFAARPLPRASACRKAQLLRMNSLRNPDFLYEGQRLRIAGEAVAVTQAEAE